MFLKILLQLQDREMHIIYFCIVLKFNLLSKILFLTVKEISEEHLAKVF